MNKLKKSFGLLLLLLLGMQPVRAVPVAETAQFAAEKVIQTNLVQEVAKQFPNALFGMLSGVTTMTVLTLSFAALCCCYCCIDCGEDLQWDPERDKRH